MPEVLAPDAPEPLVVLVVVLVVVPVAASVRERKDSSWSRKDSVLPMKVVRPFMVSFVSFRIAMASALRPVNVPEIVPKDFEPLPEPPEDPPQLPSVATVPDEGSIDCPDS